MIRLSRVGDGSVKAARHRPEAIRHKIAGSESSIHVPIIRIDDAADARLADYQAVSKPDLAARNGVFVAEGRLVVRRLLAAGGFATRSVLGTEPVVAALADALARRPEVPVFLVRQHVMNDIAGFDIHRGCLGIGERPAVRRWQDIVNSQIPTPNSQGATPNSQGPAPKRIVVLERVANADNVGGVFRSAAAFGADGVLLDPATTDPLYRKAIRTSMGAALQVPFARADPWPGALTELRRLGFAVIAMTPLPRAQPLREAVDAVAGRPVAILLGHEGDGLSASAMAACEVQARIPIDSDVDSLNVVSAAAIALYEFAGSASRNPAYDLLRGTDDPLRRTHDPLRRTYDPLRRTHDPLRRT
jgi:tRNA G18 (ribose-2'-O)-methylase SpoU